MYLINSQLNHLHFACRKLVLTAMLKLTSYHAKGISDFQLENKFFLEAIFENCDSC